MSGGGQQHICYYSNNCPWSKAFIMELSQTPWKGEFHFICVDKSPSRPTLPGWLKEVPTLVVRGENEPRTGAGVMNWLYERKMREGGGGGANRGGGQQQTSAPASMGGEPDAWNTIEQGTFSHGISYSGLDVDTSAQGDGGMTMPGAFAFLRGATAEGSQGAGGYTPAGGVGTKKSKKEELFDKQMEAYQRERDSGMPRFAQRM